MEQKPDSDEHAPNSVSAEYTYFDGMHSRVRGNKTLTLWVYHHGMCKVVLLAVMETESENNDMVTIFFNLFNQCLKALTGDNSYTFSPYGCMVDEASANFNAIQGGFGKEMLAHTVTCQWHFKACAKCQLPSIMPDQNTFIDMIGKLCKTYVRSEYIRVVAVLVEICKANEIVSWWEWWEAQKFHFVPAFRGFCILDLNLADVGHAMLKTSCKMWLSMDTHRDICHFMV